MQVILLETIKNLGDLGSVVDVRPGYGRNFLIPQGKALPATKNNLAEVEERRADLEKQAAELLTAAQARAEKLAEATITVGAKSGDEGKLFGSVGTSDIAHAISDTGVAVERSEIRMPEGVFRSVGEYEVHVHLHSDVNATVKVVVVAE